MEPVTHFLTGACLGRAGLNRKTAYATLAAVLAAEAADIDVLWGLGGPVEELKHHRGILHTFVAAPVLAAATLGAVWLIDRGWRMWRERRGKSVDPEGRKIRWGWLYATALLSGLSHLFLDWTNNYGVRPFYPFNPRWYAGSFVFIAEPALWVLLFAAMIFPWLLGLTDAEIGARKKKFRGRGWAVFALCGTIAVWGWRWLEHDRALAQLDNLQIAADPVRRMAVEPYPLNPWRWHAILETDAYFQTAEVNTRTSLIDTNPLQDVLYKPPVTPAVTAAKGTPLGQVYLDWASWAVVRDMGQRPIPGIDPPKVGPGRTWTTVEFFDLRYDYSFIGTGRPRGTLPLSGAVYIVDGHDEAGMMLNGRGTKIGRTGGIICFF